MKKLTKKSLKLIKKSLKITIYLHISIYLLLSLICFDFLWFLKVYPDNWKIVPVFSWLGYIHVKSFISDPMDDFYRDENYSV